MPCMPFQYHVDILFVGIALHIFLWEIVKKQKQTNWAHLFDYLYFWVLGKNQHTRKVSTFPPFRLTVLLRCFFLALLYVRVDFWARCSFSHLQGNFLIIRSSCWILHSLAIFDKSQTVGRGGIRLYISEFLQTVTCVWKEFIMTQLFFFFFLQPQTVQEHLQIPGMMAEKHTLWFCCVKIVGWIGFQATCMPRQLQSRAMGKHAWAKT